MQAKCEETFEHAKAPFKSLAFDGGGGERGQEHEMSSLIGSGDQVLQLQTPIVDLELVHGFGDYAFEQCHSDTLDIGDDGMTSPIVVEMDTEIFTGVGDDQEVDQH